MAVGVTSVGGEDARALREERDRLREELAAERSKGFLRRLFGGTTEPPESVRERTRGRIAFLLIGTLLVVVAATFWYIARLSAAIDVSAMDDVINVMQSFGTTLLAPLVGLIGAVIGFYFGGQTAVQGAQTAAQAASQGAQQSTQAAAETTRAVVSQVASELASQTPTDQPRQQTTEQP